MPQIPYNVDMMTPSDRPLETFRIQSSPEAFGAGAAQAANRAGNQGLEAMIYLKGLKNETAAKEGDITLNNKVLKQLYDPQNGYFTKRGKDAVDAYQPTSDAINQAYEDTRRTLPSDEARRMFDLSAVRSVRGFQISTASHSAQENKSWMVGTAEGRITNQINVSAAFWNDDQKFDQGLQTIRDETIARAELLGRSHDETQADITHYTSAAIEARIRATANHDVVSARDMFMKYNDGTLNDQHVASISSMLDNKEWTMANREAAKAAREDRESEHALRKANADTLNSLTVQYLRTGVAAPPNQIADLLESHQLDESGFRAYTAITKAGPAAGSANPELLGQMYDKAAKGDLTTEDVNRGITSGIIPKKSAGQFYKMANAELSFDGKFYRGELKAIIGADALDRGFITDPTHAAQVRDLFAQAEREYHDRLQANEKPSDVYMDMEPRYSKVSQTPASWPTPRSGSVHDVKEAEAAFKALDPKDPHYDFEKELLSKYATFYHVQDARMLKAKETGGGKEGKGTNKVVGVKTNE